MSTTHTPKAVVIGAVNFDVTYTAPRVPEPGETILGDGYLAHGGKGANQAVALSMFGIDSALITRVGTDIVGGLLIDELTCRSVDTRGIGIDQDLPSGLGFVWLSPYTENTAVVSAGANAALNSDDVNDFFDRINRVDVVVAQLEVSIEAVAAGLRHGREIGALTVLNAAPVIDGVVDLLPLADYVIVNESEFAALASEVAGGGDGSTSWPCEEQTTFATFGEHGVAVHRAGSITRVPGEPVGNVVDATGAGDAFCAAVVAALLANWSPEKAARLGASAGAMATQIMGARIDEALAKTIVSKLGESDE